jgi:two-component system sensor histidine kinase SenX3
MEKENSLSSPKNSPEPGLNEELIHLRRQKSELEAELKEARTSNQQYLQNVAHQLTAPLGAIKWSIEALKDTGVSIERKYKLLSSIYSQATILVHLIKNFALMSNLEADLELGQFREKPEPVDTFRLCINLANDFQPQAGESEKKIVVDEESFAHAMQKKNLQMVKNLIAQAVSNLLENAVKYSDSRSTILIDAERGNMKGSDFVAICVSSTGIPVGAEEKKRLFERGFRGNSARQRVPAGTGIGLYLAKRVMMLHRGAISISTEGKVARFKLIFPASGLV